MNYRYKRRQRRSYAGLILLILLVAGLIGAVNVAPPVLSYFRLVRVAANEPALVTTTVVESLPPTPPSISRRGFCESRSALVPRTNAWRCSVRNETYDPCFSIGESQTVVCGADPLAGILGFRLDLTMPLPARAIGAGNPHIKPATLLGMEYSIDLIDKPVRLVNGQFYAPPAGVNSNAILVALSEMQANGDLDDDGDEDVAALLVADAGAEGMYIYLAAIANENGTAQNRATILLGDRVQVDNLEIENGQIVADMKIHSPTDPICCPSQSATHYYNLVGNELVRWVDGWRLTLADGVACASVVQESPDGTRRPAYRCSDGRWLQSGLVPGKVWYAQFDASQPSSKPDGEYTPIARLWQ